MTISIWRCSHLALAISSFTFIFLASATGIILALEPIENQLKPYALENAEQVSLSKLVSVLNAKYDEVIAIDIDSNDFVSASVVSEDGKNKTFYVDTSNGEKIGDIIGKAPIFKFATNLHRSLFLKSTGRLIVGLVSLILLFMAITGILLIIKRQGGTKRYFSKVVKENFEQYYHIIFGKYMFVPIVIITLSGVYLSLEKFSILPEDKITHNIEESSLSKTPRIAVADFPIFKDLQLKDIKRIEFPFSENVEDYFLVELLNGELLVNQYTGQTISEQKESVTSMLSRWSLMLHTGEGTILWALILMISCFSILFFIYSGFTMTLKRRKKSPLPNNRYSKDEAKYIILVGSETGSTLTFASAFYNALINVGNVAFISELNTYSTYRKAKHLIIFTATYGEGESPTNAKDFKNLLHAIPQKNELNYSVVGFGSLMYPKFCKYAIMVDEMLQFHPNFKPDVPICKVNNQSHEAFKDWLKQWNGNVGLQLDIPRFKNKKQAKKELPFTVISKTTTNVDDSFLIRLKPNKKAKFTSGDLLSIYPKSDPVERLYSVGKIDDDIILSIKKHHLGKCSNYLDKLKQNDMISASIKRNYDFHFPINSKEVVMIANGTGMTPFLGMINNNEKQIKTHLFWGGRTRESFGLYSKMIDEAFANKSLTSVHTAYSREQEQKIYVQDLLQEQSPFICELLQNGGVIMICGSVAMQSKVLEILGEMTSSKLNLPLSEFENREQIKMDCY